MSKHFGGTFRRFYTRYCFKCDHALYYGNPIQGCDATGAKVPVLRCWKFRGKCHLYKPVMYP